VSPERTESDRRPDRPRVLVVDDSRVNRAVAEAMLRRLGCDVATAADGREAVAAVDTSSYDLVLMDCEMPRMDGFAATAEIRRREGIDPGRTRTWVVAVTGGATSADREQYRAAGMDDCLGKPFTLRDLEALVSRCLGNPAAAPG
jgi:two-component system, sensor histidine kinase and response regulator